MGQLVFQATLGGQVNLVGPNTASTFNINVPAVAGNMVTTGDTGTVINTMLAGSIANAKLTNSSVTIGSTSVALGATATTVSGLTLTNPIVTTTIGVGGATPANTGSGVSFPATQSISSDANTLDDYEKGTWTPVVTNSGFTSATTNGTYTKIGRVVNITANIQFNTVGTATGSLTLSGLPFTASFQAYGVCRETAATGVIYYPTIDSGVTVVSVQSNINGPIIWTNGYIYRFSITYITA